MRQYTVTATVESKKFGKGQLVATLTEPEFLEYANLSDRDKLAFLKDKGAEFRVALDDIEDDEVSAYQVTKNAESSSTTAQPVRQMRFNINGKDSGWIDVDEKNEAQYNQLMDRFNEMNQRFQTMSQRMNDEFTHFFPKMRENHWLDAFDHSPFGLLSHHEDEAKTDDEDEDQKPTDNK